MTNQSRKNDELKDHRHLIFGEALVVLGEGRRPKGANAKAQLLSVPSTDGLAIVFNDGASSKFGRLAGELKATLTKLLVFEHRLAFRSA